MKARFLSQNLLSTASVLSLTAAVTLASSYQQPVEAAQGIFGGGSWLPALVMRQLFDCYHGSVLPGDGYVIGTPFPAPGKIPTTCTVGALTTVEGLYALVTDWGSVALNNNDVRSFISNNTHLLLSSPTRGTVSTLSYFPLPNPNPTYFDTTTGSAFGKYPYPELDFTISDATLSYNLPANWLTTVSYTTRLFVPSTNWQTLPLLAAITIPEGAFDVVVYSTATFGQPIQIPGFEVPIAIAINTTTTTAAVWNIKSKIGGTGAGSAIQLTAPQLCAIFSGRVGRWGDSTQIPWLDKTGAQKTELFNAANTSTNTGAGANYLSSGALPISVVYDSQPSGETFILTNYLAAVCPLFDIDYYAIFTGIDPYKRFSGLKPLPSNNFIDLINNIEKVYPTTYWPKENWFGTTGSGNVAFRINNNSENAGRIGAVSVNLTQPYAKITTAPLSASIQDEYLRASGVYHPGVGAGQTTFIAPTPANASLDWAHITAPNTNTATFYDWNVYNQKFTSGVSGGVYLAGKNILPFETSANAYPLTGTTFLELYSCYSDSTAGTPRVHAITAYLAWFLGGSNSSYPHGVPSDISRKVKGYDPDVGAILTNNGFNTLPASFAGAVYAQYVLPSAAGGSTQAIAAYNTSGAQVDGCKGVTGGGAK